ncbi:hypothetical protein [Photobacterium kasasachensis]|uniref:hypothetical protein n=1 Tax=Photobacterium kasasachensis TaxID=2910240 RepID=UPI003D0F85BA
MSDIFKFVMLLVVILLNVIFARDIVTSGESNTWADISGLATANIALLTALIVWFGYKQLTEIKKDNNRSLSQSAYGKYLQMALEYPQLAFPQPETLKNNDLLYSQYRWFVANMLFSFEETLISNVNAKDWKKSIAKQIEIHKWHIKNSNYLNVGWDDSLVEIIDSVVKNSYVKKHKHKVYECHDQCYHIYEEYLNLIMSHPEYYIIRESFDDSFTSKIEYHIFVKKALFLLGRIDTMSDGCKDWSRVIKEELNHFHHIFKDGIDYKNRSLILGEHQHLIES